MALTFSIKDVPDEVADALRTQAARNRRSLQGELLHILETAVRPAPPFQARLLQQKLKAIGLSTPAESTEIVRARRNAR